MRRTVHLAFDPLWQGKTKTSTKRAARGRAYATLAEAMSLPLALCHIGMFTITQCNDALAAIQRIKENGLC